MSQKRLKISLIVFSVFLFLIPLIIAHGEEIQSTAKSSGWATPTPYIIIVGIFLIIMTFFIITFGRSARHKHKIFLFWLMSAPVILVSLYLAGHTIYDIVSSESNGPVHWHADYQIYVCEQRLDLVDPQGLKNKIGSPIFHEHNDDRIHVEGIIKNLEDISLKNYFATVGGELDHGHLVYPTNEIVYDYKNGEACADNTLGTLKVYINGRKEENFEDYLIYPNPNVPPGDCIIILFDSTNSDTTKIICDTWQVKGWSYDNYERPSVKVGDHIWQ